MEPVRSIPPQPTAALDELRQWLLRALEGRGRMIFLLSETTHGCEPLLEHLIPFSHDLGVKVCRVVFADACHPYRPWVAIVDELLRVCDDDALALGMRARAGLLALDGDQAASFAVLDTTASFISEVAYAQPLALLLLDIGSACPEPLYLLTFVARAVLRAPVLIVGTVHEPLRPESAALLRGELARESRRLNLVAAPSLPPPSSSRRDRAVVRPRRPPAGTRDRLDR